jgi:hypothetical protein
MAGAPSQSILDDIIKRMGSKVPGQEAPVTGDQTTGATTSADALNQIIQRVEQSAPPATEQPTPAEMQVAESGPATVNPNLQEQGIRAHTTPSNYQQQLDEVAQTTTQKFGGEFDPNKSPSKYIDFWMARSKNAEDVKAKFEKEYPQGDLMKVVTKDGSQSFVFREDKDKPWGLVGGTPAWLGGKMLTPEFGAAVGTALATRGASLPARMVAQGVTGMVASQADTTIERVAGYDKQAGGTETAGRTFVSGAVSAGAEALPPAAKALNRLYQTARGFGIKGILSREMGFGAGYVRAAEEEGLQQPVIGQVSGDPKITTMFNQTASASPVVRNLVNKQKSSLQQALERKAGASDYEALSGPQLERLAAEQEANIKKMVPQGADVGSEEASQAMQVAVDGWQETQRRGFARRFARQKAVARTQDVAFDLGDVQAVAADIERGVIGASAAGEPVAISEPVGRLLNKLRTVQELGQTVKTGPRISSKVDDPLTQMMALRDDALTLMNSRDPRQKEQATALYNAIKGSMETPSSKSPLVTESLRTLIEDYSNYETKSKIMRGFFKDAPPEQLANELFQPGNMEVINTLRETAPEAFDKAKEAFATQLRNNPDEIIATLDRFKKSNAVATLHSIMDAEEEDMWRSMASARKAWEKSRTRAMAGADQPGDANAQAILFGKGKPTDDPARSITIDGAALEDFLRGTSGGKQGEAAQGLKAGIYKRILEESMKTSGEAAGEKMVSPKDVISMIDQLTTERNKRILDSLMTQSDWKSLDNFRRYAVMLDETGQKASELSTRQRMLKLVNPVNILRDPQSYALTALSILNQDHLAKILSDPVTSAMFARATELGPTGAGARMFSAAAAQAARGGMRGYPSKDTNTQ